MNKLGIILFVHTRFKNQCVCLCGGMLVHTESWVTSTCMKGPTGLGASLVFFQIRPCLFQQDHRFCMEDWNKRAWVLNWPASFILSSPPIIIIKLSFFQRLHVINFLEIELYKKYMKWMNTNTLTIKKFFTYDLNLLFVLESSQGKIIDVCCTVPVHLLRFLNIFGYTVWKSPELDSLNLQRKRIIIFGKCENPKVGRNLS